MALAAFPLAHSTLFLSWFSAFTLSCLLTRDFLVFSPASRVVGFFSGKSYPAAHRHLFLWSYILLLDHRKNIWRRPSSGLVIDRSCRSPHPSPLGLSMACGIIRASTATVIRQAPSTATWVLCVWAKCSLPGTRITCDLELLEPLWAFSSDTLVCLWLFETPTSASYLAFLKDFLPSCISRLFLEAHS